MSANPLQPVKLLEYRSDLPDLTWRDPVFSIVPFAVGAFVGGAAGIIPLLPYAEGVAGTDVFSAAMMAGVLLCAVEVMSFGVVLALRYKLSRDVLTARRNITCFIAALCIGAITLPIDYLFYRWSNARLEDVLYLLLCLPSVGALIAGCLLLRKLRIKQLTQQ